MNRLRTGATRVLLVDGDASARSGLARALQETGYETREEESATAAQLAVEDFQPELILLEVVLSDGDRLQLARRLLEHRPRARLIFLTSCDTTEAKVVGLALADDYITKPVDRIELQARIRAIVRRIPARETVLRFSGLFLNQKTREVRNRGEAVELTPREFDLLRLFMLNPGRVLSKGEILGEVWPPESRPGVVETYVGYLRRKLGSPLIQTVRLVGYVLREPS